MAARVTRGSQVHRVQSIMGQVTLGQVILGQEEARRLACKPDTVRISALGKKRASRTGMVVAEAVEVEEVVEAEAEVAEEEEGLVSSTMTP